MTTQLRTDCLDEGTLASFVDRRLSEPERERVDSHIDTCASCRGLVSSLAQIYLSPASKASDSIADEASESELSLPFERGTKIGRYVLDRLLGAGGMGVVYAAHDPDLARTIALKVLRPEISAAGHAAARLMREARAMARLSHPNVIAVHDVGTFGDRVFVAMEFVEGSNLAAWLKEPRSIQAVLRTFVQAGHGLAAAHAVGLVHRDFKPSNVLIGNDGRVRVGDFGLVYLGESETESEADVSSAPLTVTRTGALLGTPAYMAPEQHLGLAVDARTDQFSFCVALHEAVYGERPFSEGTLEELASAVVTGTLRAPARRHRAPRWLRRAIRKGLATEPDARYVSMDALLAVLDRHGRATWIRAAAALAVVSLFGGVVALQRHQSRPCRGAERKLSGIWDQAQRAHIAAAFSTSKSPLAAESWPRVEQVLDRYSREFVSAHTDACEATRVRGEQSDEALSLRMLCLDERLEGLRALTELFTHADAAVVARSVPAAYALQPLTSCRETELLRSHLRPPADPQQRDRVQALRRSLERVKALTDVGQNVAAIDEGTSLVAAAEALGYKPVEAEAYYLLAVAKIEDQAEKDAEPLLLKSVWAAQASGHERLLALAWGQLATVAVSVGSPADIDQRLKFAEAAAARVDDGGEAQALLLRNRGVAYWHEGRFADAVKVHEESLALARRRLGDEHPDLVDPYVTLSLSLALSARYPEAEAASKRAIALAEQAYGPDNPLVAKALLQQSQLYARIGKVAEQSSTAARAVAILQSSDHRDLLEAFETQGLALLTQGRNEEAKVAFEKAIASAEKLKVPKLAGNSLAYLGQVQERLGLLEEARVSLERALTLQEQTLGRVNPYLLTTLHRLVALDVAAGRHREALALAERELEIAVETHGPDHVRGLALLSVGQAQAALGQLPAALAALDSAQKLLTPSNSRPDYRAAVEFELARVLWDSGKDRSRAIALAHVARDLYTEALPGTRKWLEKVDRWLATHRNEERNASQR